MVSEQKENRIQPVILCGGSGTRLWPLSRAGFPKQFLCLAGKESLFQQAMHRLTALGNRNDGQKPLIVVNEEHRFLVSEQLREVNLEAQALLLEPVSRNTAPALTFAALAAQNNGQDPVLVVTPADQNIKNQSSFLEAMHKAIRAAESGAIAILGIRPDRPETGYGYIHAKQADGEAWIVERFVEKPDTETARQYLVDGNYYWNAGIFVLKASVWLAALQRFQPDILHKTQAAWGKCSTDGKFIRPGDMEFHEIPSESIDYAVMESCPKSGIEVSMVPLDAGWSDLGSWEAVWHLQPKDSTGNAHIGDVMTTDSHNTFVHASSRLVSVVGISNVVVVETSDAVLVADKSRSQDVKNIVNQLQAENRGEQLLHRKVHRPWGWYDSIDEGPNFKVKRIRVNPKASLSLQKHHHRAEHWVVVKGTAEIVCGDRTLLLSENQSTYIPLGEMHRLTNPGEVPLEIIEVQSGSYLGEDDIIRVEDDYGR